MQTKYLIIGGSHAGLSAVEAIQRCDSQGTLTLLTREKRLPYSPTALPYIISGKADPEKTALRPADFFKDLTYINGVFATRIDTKCGEVFLDDGRTIGYEKLLIATGAEALVPGIPGIDSVEFSCLRTLADAQKIRKEMARADSAIILGAGFIGMHAAENLANAGVKVTIVEAVDQIMPNSFDPQASGLIRTVFEDNGIAILTGKTVSGMSERHGKKILSLTDGKEISGDMLVIAAGITPNTGFLEGSGIECNNGVVVDERMRTSIPNIWAAGDVAVTPGFFSPEKAVGGTIPCATEQGSTAGMDMGQDAYATAYTGHLNVNTFGFFGSFAFSIGHVGNPSADKGVEIETRQDPKNNKFCRFVFKDNVLTGVSAINMQLDPGILKELILRRTDLSTRKQAFVKMPLETGRQVMRELF